MDENDLVEEIEEKGLTRQDLLKRTAGVGLGLSALGVLEIQPALGASELTKVKWISPRGTLDFMDDFNLLLPIKNGFLRWLGLGVRLRPGRSRGNLSQVTAGEANIGYPSAGLVTLAIERGFPV